LYLQAGGAGLATAVAAGALLSILPLGFLAMFALLAVGYVVGEAVSRASRRLPYRELAIVAFVCACLGPTLGRALLLALLVPFPDAGARALLALTAAFQSLGPFGVLVSIIAGIIASNRVTR
jgi:hypothetical protein